MKHAWKVAIAAGTVIYLVDDGRLHDAASGDRDFMDPDRNIDLGGSGISAGTVVLIWITAK